MNRFSNNIDVPWTRAWGFGPLPDLTEQMAGAKVLTKIFSTENIPLEVIEYRNLLVPLPAMARIFDAAARAAGSRTFGYRVGEEMRPVDFGSWTHYSAAAPTLGDGLWRLSETVQFHQREAKFSLVSFREAALMRYVAPRKARFSAHHSDHVLAAIIRFVRTFLGASWTPRWVELDYSRDADAHLLEEMVKCPIIFEKPGVGVAIAHADLAASRVIGPDRHPTLLDVCLAAKDIAESDAARSVMAIIALRLSDGRSDIDGAAELAGIGTQRLQRLLRQEGLTYRTLVNRARLLRAKSLLIETALSVTQIAMDLGYSDQANFTRAFRREAGCSPLAYRQRGKGSSVQS